MLKQYIATVPKGIRIKRIDDRLYHLALKEEWSRDLCSNFEDERHFSVRFEDTKMPGTQTHKSGSLNPALPSLLAEVVGGKEGLLGKILGVEIVFCQLEAYGIDQILIGINPLFRGFMGWIDKRRIIRLTCHFSQMHLEIAFMLIGWQTWWKPAAGCL